MKHVRTWKVDLPRGVIDQQQRNFNETRHIFVIELMQNKLIGQKWSTPARLFLVSVKWITKIRWAINSQHFIRNSMIWTVQWIDWAAVLNHESGCGYSSNTFYSVVVFFYLENSICLIAAATCFILHGGSWKKNKGFMTPVGLIYQ